MDRRYTIAFLTFLFFIVSIIYISCTKDNKKKTQQNSKAASVEFLPDDIFEGDLTCRECHQKEYDEWKGSHHDLAMQKADPTSVLGDFNEVVFANDDSMKTRFYRKNREFWVNTQGGDGEYHDYKVIYTFGVTPLQQYIIEFPEGRFQCLSTAWDTIEKKWFDLYHGLHVVRSEWLHQSKGAMNWNMMCADCHSTNVRKNFDESTNAYHTRYSIINVSCEACHGPGKTHVEHARKKERDYKVTPDEKLWLAKNISSKEQVDECARCHSRREQLTAGFNFEGSYLDHYSPQLLTEGRYHSDGQILDEVYVYGSFLQSKMYRNDVKCTNCHNPHTLKLKFEGNALCQQCHEPKKYNTSLHTFHKENTEASKCINCHMTGKNYMINDFRRDHSFRIPRPDLSMKYDTPNACNQCHTDKTAEWAWEACKKWYGENDTIYYTDILSLARTGDPSSIPQLIELSGDTNEPSIVRATAIHYLGAYNDRDGINKIVSYLTNADPLIRATSAEALNEFGLPENSLLSLYKLLNDSVRLVRIRAFKALAGIPVSQVPEQYRKFYAQAKQEFLNQLNATADFSAGQANKAIYYERTGDVDKAISAYLQALEIDDHNNQVRNNLANLYYQKGELDKAETTFRKIIEQEPDYGYTYYSLGLLLAEKGFFDEAITSLEKAVKLLPENTRIYYNLGLIYQNQGAQEKAKSTFEKGLKVNAHDARLLYAMVFLYANNLEDINTAIQYAEKLTEYYPENKDYKQLLENLKRNL